MDEAYEQEVERADEALRRHDFEAAFSHLERAHVLVQRMTGRHTFIHNPLLKAEEIADLCRAAGAKALVALGPLPGTDSSRRWTRSAPRQLVPKHSMTQDIDLWRSDDDSRTPSPGC